LGGAQDKPDLIDVALAHPAYPRYKGSGDVNDAANFTCSTE
jgi:hypothetical protein